MVEQHRIHKSGWLRAAVLGANDGITSTASLMLGIVMAHGDHTAVLIAGISGLVAGGSVSMAAGEYVSVHSQMDTEKADMSLERRQLLTDRATEVDILITIYKQRGLNHALAVQVAEELMNYDALATLARDEIGITETLRARPAQAALTSAFSFMIGSSVPLVAIFAGPHMIAAITASSLLSLSILGSLAAYAGGASTVMGLLRVTFWGALAMSITAAVGMLFGVVVG